MSPLTQQSRVLKPFGLHVKLEAVGPLFFPSSRCDTNGHVVQLDAKLSSFAWLELKQVDCIMQTLVFDNCKLVVVPVERKIQTSCRKLWDVLLGADEHFRRRWQLDSATSNGMDRVKLDFYPPFFTNLLHELVTLPSWKDAGVIMGYNANGEACVLNLEITEVSALYNILLILYDVLAEDAAHRLVLLRRHALRQDDGEALSDLHRRARRPGAGAHARFWHPGFAVELRH